MAASEALAALPPVAAALPYAYVYERRVATLSNTSRAVPRWRRASFHGGLVLIVVSLVPPIGVLDDRLLWVHMVQHLLLGDLGPVAIVLGLTGPLLAPVLRFRVVAALRRLSTPLVAFSLWALNLYVWHIPALYQAALHSEGIHVLEHALYVALGVNMWMALLGPLPMPVWFGNLGRLAYIIGVRLWGTLLANVLLWAGSTFYPDYAPGERRYGVSPASDQVLAGSILMIEGSIVTLMLFGWLFVRAARQSQERQELVEYAAAQGVALSDSRAGRAVAAGRGEDLRRRVEG